MSIRYNKEFNKEIASIVKSFNYRVGKLQASDKYQGIKLPEKMRVAALKAQYDSRSELRKALNAMKRFSRPGALEIVSTAAGDKLQYELSEVAMKRSQARAYLTSKMRFYESAKIKVIGADNVASTLSQTLFRDYRDMQRRYKELGEDITKLTPAQYKMQVELINANLRTQDTKRMANFQNNMIKAFSSKNRLSGERTRLDKIVEELGNLSPREFYYRFQTSEDFQRVWEEYYDWSKSDNRYILHQASDADFEEALDTVVSNTFTIFESPLE